MTASNTVPAAELRPMLDRTESEEHFQQRVIKLALAEGWAPYHTRRSKGSHRGWPDLVLVRVPRLVVAELKRESGQPTRDQLFWLQALKACGVETYTWRPSDWEEIERALGARGRG